MLEAIGFLHDMKLVHTDLKPENVLLVSTDYHCQQVGGRRKRVLTSNADVVLVVVVAGNRLHTASHPAAQPPTNQQNS